MHWQIIYIFVNACSNIRCTYLSTGILHVHVLIFRKQEYEQTFTAERQKLQEEITSMKQSHQVEVWELQEKIKRSGGQQSEVIQKSHAIGLETEVNYIASAFLNGLNCYMLYWRCFISARWFAFCWFYFAFWREQGKLFLQLSKIFYWNLKTFREVN